MLQSLKWIYLRHLLVLGVSLCLLAYGVWGLVADTIVQPQGAAGTQIADALTSVPVPAPSAADSASDTMPLLYIALIIASMLMIITSTVNLYVRTVRYVRHDIESLVRMFHDIHDGHIRVDYPMLLREFSGIFRFLRSSGTQTVR